MAANVPVTMTVSAEGVDATTAALNGVAATVTRVGNAEKAAGATSMQLRDAVSAVSRSADEMRTKFGMAAQTVGGFKNATMSISSALRGDFASAAMYAGNSLRALGAAFIANPVLAAVAAVTIAVTAIGAAAERSATKALESTQKMAEAWVRARNKMRIAMGRTPGAKAEKQAEQLFKMGDVRGIDAALEQARKNVAAALASQYEAAKGDDEGAYKNAEAQTDAAQDVLDVWQGTYSKMMDAENEAFGQIKKNREELRRMDAARAGTEADYWLTRSSELKRAAAEFTATTATQTMAGRLALQIEAEEARKQWERLQANTGVKTPTIKPQTIDSRQRGLEAAQFGSVEAARAINRMRGGAGNVEQRQLTALEQIARNTEDLDGGIEVVEYALP